MGFTELLTSMGWYFSLNLGMCYAGVWGRLEAIILLNISSVQFSLPSPSGTPLTHLSCFTGH